MQNCKIDIDGNVMTITIDLSTDLGPSKSGKSNIVATTAGNVTVGTPPNSVTVGLNVYRKTQAAQP